MREDIEELKETLAPEAMVEKEEVQVIGVEKGPIEVGCFVRIIGQETMGEVLQLKGKDVLVAFGDIKTTLKLNRVERISKGVFSKNQRAKTSSISRQISEKTINFSGSLDVRGLRGEEALKEVENLIDNAINYTPSSAQQPGVITARVLPDPFSHVLLLQVEVFGKHPMQGITGRIFLMVILVVPLVPLH